MNRLGLMASFEHATARELFDPGTLESIGHLVKDHTLPRPDLLSRLLLPPDKSLIDVR
jgi:hypothetical protein